MSAQLFLGGFPTGDCVDHGSHLANFEEAVRFLKQMSFGDVQVVFNEEPAKTVAQWRVNGFLVAYYLFK